MKSLNLKPITKNLSALEKAKLLCGDTNRRNETDRQEFLLTPDEEAEIFKEARAKNEIDYINRIIDIYNWGIVLMGDLQLTFLAFQVSYEKLLGLLGKISLRTLHLLSMQEVEMFLYFLNSEKNAELSEETKKQQNKLEEKLAKKSQLDDPLSLWTPQLSQNTKSQPNIYLQRRFLETIEALQQHLRVDCQIDCLIERAEFNFLSKRFQAAREHYSAVREEFLKLEGLLTILTRFRKEFVDFDKDDIMFPIAEFEYPEFISAIEDPRAVVQLSEAEKEEAEVEVDELLKNRSPRPP